MIPNTSKFKSYKKCVFFLVISFLLFNGQSRLIAQLPLTADGQTHTITFNNNDKVQEYKLPSHITSGRIYFETFGADGGKKIGNGGNTRAKGGQGAQIGAWFEIGNGNKLIPPEATILFIPGEHGHNRQNGSATGAGGGGGSAVFYQRSNGDWTLLQVAGGGRGGAADCCTVELHGYPAEAHGCVIVGHGAEGTNSHCHYGDVILSTLCNAGGSAIYDNIDHATGGTTYSTNNCNYCRPGMVGWPGATSIPTNSVKPTGGLGGGYNANGTPCVSNNRKGGFGFGGGAAGGPGAGINGGGSGGGFTAHVDRGGGSYLNEAMAMDDQPQHRIKRSNTSDPQDGRTKYAIFTPPVAVCDDLTVTLPSSGEMTLPLTDFTTSSYTYNTSEVLFSQNAVLADINELLHLNLDCSDIGTQTVLINVRGSISDYVTTCTATLTVIENSPPALDCNNVSVTTANDGTLSLSPDDIPYTVTNGCEDFILFQLDNTTFSYDCDLDGQTVSEMVTVTAIDQLGNTDSCTSILTVNVNIIDDTPPTALCAPLSVQLDGQGQANVSAADIDAGSTDNCSIITRQLLKPNVHLEIKGDRYVHETFWQINSLDGNTTYAFEDPYTLPIIVYSVNPINYNPTHFFRDITLLEGCYDFLWDDGFFTDGFLCGLEGETLYYKVTDDDGNTLAYDECEGIGGGGTTEICVPAPNTVDNLTFTCDDIGEHQISLQVTDGVGNKSLCTTTITVDYAAPLCSPIEVQLPTADAQVQVSANDLATNMVDECGNNLPYYFAVPALQLEIESDGINSDLSWEITSTDGTTTYAQGDDLYYYYGLGSNKQISHLVVDIPYVKSGDMTFHWNDSFGDGFICDTPEEHYYSLKKVNGEQLAYGACGDIGHGQSTDISPYFNAAERFYTLDDKVYTCSDAGVHYVTVGVLLSNNKLETCKTTIKVNPPPPVAQCQDVTAQLNANGKIIVKPEDFNDNSIYPCDGYQRLSTDLGKTQFKCGDVGTRTVTFTAEDNYGGSSSCTTTLTIEDVNPPEALCKALNVQLDETSGNVSILPTQINDGSNDVCGIASTTGYSLSKSLFTCADVGQNTVTLTVTDVNGNAATCTAIVTVEETIAPNAVCKNITVQLDDTGNATITNDDIDDNSSDACGIVSRVLDNTSFDCTDVGNNNTVTLTVTDANGNVSDCSAQVTVEDEVAPEALCQNLTFQLDEFGSTINITPVQIDANSSDACGIQSRSLDYSSFGCSKTGDNIVTLSVTDIHGNIGQCESVVTIEDSTPPVALCLDLTIQLNAEGNSMTLQIADVDGGSNDACGIQAWSLSKDNFSCEDVGDNTINLTVTDANGNTATCDVNVKVEDNTAPIALCQNITVGLDENGEVIITPNLIDNNSSDACSIASFGLDYNIFDCANIGNSNAVMLTATDASGNSSTCTATVNVEDHIVPTPICKNSLVELQSDGLYLLQLEDVYDAGSSYDNCGVISQVNFPTATYSCIDVGQYFPVIVTVADAIGNVNTCTANVQVEIGSSLPDPWYAVDIGQVTVGNDYAYDPCADEFSVLGSGNNVVDIFADNIAFTSYNTCGDFTLTAKIESIDPNGYGGLMVREDMNTGAKQVALFSNMSNNLRHEVRYNANSPKQVSSFFKPNPVWLRLQRQGDWIFSYSSYDGTNFQQVHSVFISMQSCVEVGLASFTYMPNAQTEAVFSNVSISGSNGGFSGGNENTATLQHHNTAQNGPVWATTNNIHLYPNPATSQFTIQMEAPLETDTKIAVLNLSGQTVATQILEAGTSYHSWQTADWTAGTYIIRMNQRDAPPLIKRLVVVK